MNALNLKVLLRRYFVLIALFVLVGSVLGAGLELRKQDVQVAALSVYADNEVGNTTLVSQDSTLSILRMDSYVRVATSDLLARALVKELDLQTSPQALSSRISATSDRDTVIMRLTVSGTDPDELERIARAIPRALTRVIDSLDINKPSTDDDRDDVTTFTLLDGPSVSPASSMLRVAISIAFGALLGLALSAALASVLLRRAERGSPSSYVADTRLPVLGIIPRRRSYGLDDPEYSRLAVNLGLSAGAAGRFVAVSAADAETSGTVAAGVARAVTRRGRSVLVIDATSTDTVPRLLGVGSGTKHRRTVAPMSEPQPTPDDPDLRVASVGGDGAYEDAAALRRALLDIFRRATGSADVVIVAGRPVLDRADLPSAAEHADLSLLVIDPSRDSHDDIEAAGFALGALSRGDVALVMHGVNARRVPAAQLQSGFVPVPPESAAAVSAVGPAERT